MLDDDVRALSAVMRHGGTERCVLGIAEEAGEVVGAYNKWAGRRVDKPKTTEDILTEMGQLIGMVYVTALRLGYGPVTVDAYTESFLKAKVLEIKGTAGLLSG